MFLVRAHVHFQVGLPTVRLLAIFTVEVLLLRTLIEDMPLQVVLVLVRLSARETVVDLVGVDQLPQEGGREVGHGRPWNAIPTAGLQS